MEFLLKFLPLETILRWVGKKLTGYDDEVINRAIEIVQMLDKTHLPGYEKRQQAYKELKELLNEMADWVINLLIEIAVAYIRIKTNREGQK